MTLPHESSRLPCNLGLRGRRLISPLLFKAAFEQNAQWPGKYVVMRVLRLPESCGRLGVISSKRTLPRAVDRNRARRLMREAFRLNRWRLLPGVDILLLARRKIVATRCQNVEHELVKLFKRAQVYDHAASPPAAHSEAKLQATTLGGDVSGEITKV